MSTELLARSGLPDDLRFLIEKYPREGWRRDHTLGQMGEFWLARHAMFRELGGALSQAAGDLNKGKTEAQPFTRWFVPRLNFFLGELNGHHQVEDQHYFPVFARAEPQLRKGFDILDADHHQIHEMLTANAEAANDFLRKLEAGGDPLKRAAERYSNEAQRLLAGLVRHLDDEEDIIIPLLLDRGEDRIMY